MALWRNKNCWFLHAVHEPFVGSTAILYYQYKGFVLSVQMLCTISTRALYYEYRRFVLLDKGFVSSKNNILMSFFDIVSNR